MVKYKKNKTYLFAGEYYRFSLTTLQVDSEDIANISSLFINCKRN